MDILFANSNREDTAFAPLSLYADIDIGKENDYVLTIPISEYDSSIYVTGGYFYVVGEEYGGKLDDPTVDTASGSISFEGDTFRGMLNQRYVEPPAGQDYLVLTGELNSLINQLVNSQFGDMFHVSTEDTGKTVTCQLNRYCSVLEGINQILSLAGYTLRIEAVAGEQFYILLSAIPTRDLSEEIEISQDYNFNFVIKKITRKYDYMLALGSGDLKDRTVLRLHRKSDGTIEQVTSFPKDVLVYKYDYSSAESVENLIEEATKQFDEINATDSQELKASNDLNLKIGDIVAGRDYITGTYISQSVTRLIVKYSNNVFNTSYEIGVI